MENFDKVVEACVGKLEGDEPYASMGWQEIVEWLNINWHYDSLRRMAYGIHRYHKHLQEQKLDSMSSDEIDKLNEKLIELKKERVKLSDLNSMLNKKIREQSRHENILECARDIAKDFNQNKPLLSNPPVMKSGDREGLLLLSDIHIGVVCENYWNKYNTEIAKKRLSYLKQRTIDICLKNDVKKLNICLLGDVISGLIHTNLRLENRENVVEQSILVVEMISEMLASLCTLFEVDLYYVVGNHERISANKNESLDKENFGYFILEMIKYRCSALKGLTIHSNKFDDEIITFDIFDKKIVATHGNNFGRLNTYVNKLTSMIGYIPDYVCVGHLHQSTEITHNNTELIINGSFSGTDSYAKNYGLIGKPSQKLMIFSEEYGRECTYNIELGRV